MNAATFIDDSMTLEQKLAAIDLAMLNAQEQFNEENGRVDVPLDPSLLTICDGCE